MIISENLAQRIVDTTMRLVNRNINIMDRDGTIIATGHPHRYKTMHKGAKDVVETGSIIEIYPQELFLYPGALQGINLPIVFDEQIVGVVGVFGYPDEVRNIGFLVKMITELILERDLVRREMRTKNRLREQFIELSVLKSVTEISPKIKTISQMLQIDILQPRTVMVIDASVAIQRLMSEYGLSEMVLDRVEDSFFSCIETGNLLTEQDIACIMGDQLIILKTNKNTDGLYSEEPIVEQLINYLADAIGGPMNCGVGAIANSITQYHTSYKQAQFCLRQCNEAQPIVQIKERDVLVHHALSEALSGSTLLAMGKLKETFSHMVVSNSEICNTLSALIKCNLNINDTAQMLHIHRNTLLYRLNRFEAETGLAPCRSIDDMILCRFLLQLVN